MLRCLSEPLCKNLTIVGPVEARLWVESSVPDTCISVLPVLVCNCTESNKDTYNVVGSGMTSSANSRMAKVGSGVAAKRVDFYVAENARPGKTRERFP